jgi:hypothetical protein
VPLGTSKSIVLLSCCVAESTSQVQAPENSLDQAEVLDLEVKDKLDRYGMATLIV